MALIELQTQLQETYTVEVSLATILQSLQWEGYTMKWCVTFLFD